MISTYSGDNPGNVWVINVVQHTERSRNGPSALFVYLLPLRRPNCCVDQLLSLSWVLEVKPQFCAAHV